MKLSFNFYIKQANLSFNFKIKINSKKKLKKKQIKEKYELTRIYSYYENTRAVRHLKIQQQKKKTLKNYNVKYLQIKSNIYRQKLQDMRLCYVTQKITKI